jgi:ATP:corrinoid adenosyltransferase
LGFYNAGSLSAKNISKTEHRKAALDTLEFVMKHASSGKYDLVVCDEINNALHDRLIKLQDVKKLG